MILIADSGSTKASWILTDGKKIINNITTVGYNPYYHEGDSLLDSMKLELLPFIDKESVEKVFFYGSGCSSEINCTMVKSGLWQLFPNALVDVNHDLFGAAVALLNDGEGIACILGTGSNSCHWYGKEIIQNVPSVGYLLGDEGSGTYIGMKILKGILEERAPTNIIKTYYDKYNISFEGVLNEIYNKPKPNGFISAISIFAQENIDNDWIRATVKQSFTDFIENQIMQYSNFEKMKVCFVGSIAYHFRDILTEACNENDINVGVIIKDPIEALFLYHINK